MSVKNMTTSASIAKSSDSQRAALPDRSLFLRRVLQGNAAFSTLSGLVMLVDSKPLANFLGLADPSVISYLLALGIGLLFWAMLAFWVSTQPTLGRTGVFTIIEGDLLWIAGSIILLISGWLPFSTAGYWAVAIVADVVALFAILQYVGWRRIAQG